MLAGTRASWQPGAKKYHKVTPYNKPYTSDLFWERHRMEGASDQEPQGWTEERAFIGFGVCTVS